MTDHEHTPPHPHPHAHSHAHPHPHPPAHPDEILDYTGVLEIVIRELAIEKGCLTAGQHRRQIEILDTRGPLLGARVVARAWEDPAYRQRLLADGSAACEEVGIGMYDQTRLIVLENTAQVHNVVVCTLCSCYPRPVLGLPPDWYKSMQYRARCVAEPRQVLAEFGTRIPEHVEVRVHDSNANMRYLVMPLRPPGTEGMTQAQLAALVTRDSMIGVSTALSPQAQV